VKHVGTIGNGKILQTLLKSKGAKTMNAIELIEKIKASKANSAWARGIKLYAIDLVESVEKGYFFEKNQELFPKLLNGAQSWHEYSYGGCALVYDSDIAERLCSPSELKKCHGGEWRLRAWYSWLDKQSEALRYAYCLIQHCLS
jgi:hypothetical protein